MFPAAWIVPAIVGLLFGDRRSYCLSGWLHLCLLVSGVVRAAGVNVELLLLLVAAVVTLLLLLPLLLL